jgi:hypothetical protein
MASEDFICRTLANLKVVASVPTGGRLCVRHGHLAVDTNTRGQFLIRSIWGDSRATSLNHVRNTIDNAIDIIKVLCGDPRTPEKWESMWTLERLGAEMERCVTGIRNLRSTYSEDLCMVANLDVQADRLLAHRGELQRFFSGGGQACPPYPPSGEQ